MKTVAATLGVARSNIVERKAVLGEARAADRLGDVELAAEHPASGRHAATDGYRRIAALLKRERRSAGSCRQRKRVYRLMKKHGTLLALYRAQAAA